MQLWHFLGLLLLGCSALVEEPLKSNLKITIETDLLRGVSAGVLTLWQLELFNPDPEAVTIKKVYFHHEETYRNEQLITEPISQQFHSSRMTTMTIEPETVAIVPLTFLPRYPHDENSMPKPSNSIDGEESAPQLNSYQRSDLAQLVGEEALDGRAYYSDNRRNNLRYSEESDESEYVVSSAIVVMLENGSAFVHPFEASSVRSNKYRVPERIQFHPPPGKSKTEKSGHILLMASNRGDTPGRTQDLPSYDCYDLHLYNPSDRPLTIHEAAVSKPDSVGLFNMEEDPYLRNSKNLISGWTKDKVAQPGETIYAATICPIGESPLQLLVKPASENDPWHMDSKRDLDLGYVQLTTDQDKLVVQLEWYLTIHQFELEAAKKSRTPAPAKKHPESPATLRSVPSKFLSHLVPYVTPEVKVKLAIQNPSSVPVKIMRASLIVDKSKSLIINETGMKLNLKVGFRNACDSGSEIETDSSECQESGVIPAGSLWKDAIIFESALSSNSTIRYLRRDMDAGNELSGRIVVTATTNIASTHESWLATIQQNPHSQEKVVIEIPWIINLVEGTMHAVMEESSAPNLHLRHEIISSVGAEEITALFFPFEPLDLRDWTYWQGILGRMYDYDKEDISHTVRIMALSHSALDISSLRVVRNRNDPHKKVCDRFKVTYLEPESSGTSRGIRDLGAIQVDYSFQIHHDEFRRREGNGAIQDTIYPTICQLVFETEPVYTGKHIIDLVVFTGKLEIRSTDPGAYVRSNGVSDIAFSSRARDHLIPATVSVGFKEALAWFESSVMGASLLEYLRGFSKFGKWTPPATLFRDYIYGLGDVTEDGVGDREGFVEPILMHAGAVAHGEIITMPLYFTNHNPVPVQVFIDASEVEGMSFSIAREAPLLRGDGNSIVDFFPHKIGPRFDRIPHGPWNDHSRQGLKSFLTNNDFASQFFHFIPYRDAVEVSQRATRRMPLLRSLYKKRAKVTFHADKRPLNFYSQKMNGCDGDHKSPSNYVNIKEAAEAPGPVLLSDDMLISHRNTVCDPNFMADIFDYPRSTNMLYLKHTPVTVPPGGVARFEVKVRAPDKNSLDKDVTPFVSTGLVVSTDHGQIMPLIVTFEALLGQLKLSRSPSSVEEKRHWQQQKGFGHQYSGEMVEVPLQLFQNPFPVNDHKKHSGITIAPSDELPANANLTTWMYPLGASSVPLYLSSSFSKEVILREIESCNPWFQIALKDDTEPSSAPPSREGKHNTVEIGSLHTAVICPQFHDLLDTYHEVGIPENYTIFPSFYTCALEWLENRTLLQSYGCGTRPMPRKIKPADYGVEDDATERTLDALNHALTFSMFKYANGKLKYELFKGYEKHEDTDDKEYEEPSSRWEDFANSSVILKSGLSRTGATVDRLTLDIYSEITDAWRVISEMDLHSITSNFKATVEYSYLMGEETRRSLTLSMRDVKIRTKLSMPQLVVPKREYLYDQRKDDKSDFFSVFEFNPTLVANVVEMKIPIRNPTGVPVKVKLATASWAEIIRDAEKAEEFHTLATDEMRERYLKRFESVFTQLGYDLPTKSPGHSWWEGHGAFYQADHMGHLIQSRHNVTIRAGGKAHISLINPALYAQSAFIVGCGARCGVKDELSVGNRVDAGLRKTSPIGASAAAGVSLVGRPRVASDHDRAFNGDEPTYASGGTPFVDASPAAFAVPYSAFDEIILPPYGEAEIGPILFRPSGRFSRMGCETIIDSDAVPFGAKITEACSRGIFESMIFIENSLTGLERVVLRGKGLWENVVFLDPIGSDSLDAYGDLELRNGHTTLMFPGSSIGSYHAGRIPHPVMKGIIVQNDGDVDVSFSSVFFVGSSGFGVKKGEKHTTRQGCSLRGFRLLECAENEGPQFDNDNGGENTRNLLHGFSIPSRSNKTIFVEHFPDCTFKSDFVVLNFEFNRSKSYNQYEQQPSHVFVTGDGTHSRSQIHSESFRRRNLELAVGYDMSSTQLKSCIPLASASADAAYVSGTRNISLWNNKTFIDPMERERLNRALSLGDALRYHFRGTMRRRFVAANLLFTAVAWLISFYVVLLVLSLVRFRLKTSSTFNEILRLQRSRAVSTDRRIAVEASTSQSSWSSTYRCLARVDPTSSELQSIGREQVRQIVLHRYKTLGILLPQCIDSAGAFSREGVGQGTRNGAGGSAKLKTFSDALFQRFDCWDTLCEDLPLKPCGLGWRTAAARGILRRDSVTFISRSDRILTSRRGGYQSTSPNGMSDVLGEGSQLECTGKRDLDLDAAEGSHSRNANRLSSDSDGQSINDNLVIPVLPESSVIQRLSVQVNDSRKYDQQANTTNTDYKNMHEHNNCTQQRSSSHQNFGDKSGSRIKGRRKANSSRNKSEETSSTGSPLVQSKPSQRTSGTDGGHDEKKQSVLAKKLRSQGGHKTRNKNVSKRAGEPASPSSIRSISSRSTKTEATLSPVLSPRSCDTGVKVRPPPGLAPPPGFGGWDTSAGLDLSISSLQTPFANDLPSLPQQFPQSLSSMLPPLDTTPSRRDGVVGLDQLYASTVSASDNASSSSLFHTIRETDEKNLDISQRSFLHDSIASIDDMIQAPLLAATKLPKEKTKLQTSADGFDVMGFLGNILEDSAGDEMAGSNEGSLQHLSSDPWAPGRKSRAAAYGISVEENAANAGKDAGDIVHASLAMSPHHQSESSTFTPVVPLLSPAALSGGGTSVFDDDDDDVASEQEDYNSGDFYAKLLGE